MSRLKIKRIAGAVCAVIILTAGAAPFLWAGTDRVIPGVRINGTPAGGMSREELETLMHDKNEELKTDVLAVKSTDGVIDETWRFSDFSVHYKDDEIDKALKAGRDGNIAKIWYDRWHAFVMGDAVHWTASYDNGALENKVKTLASEYGKPPVNAAPSFHGDGSVTFSGGRPYLKFDEKALLTDAGRILSNGTSGEADVSALDEKKPDLTEKEAKEVNVVLGRYTTEFGINGNRDKNIEIAAKSIKGVYVKPGESFSYNQATGARSKENGYQEAPVIINGKLEPGIGGGVCQVSTTLFNAALLSGLEITQRANHYSPIHYAPIGRDATVAEGIIDFAFHNDLKHGVYLYSDYTPGSVTIYILGNREDRPSYVDISTDKNDVIPNKTRTKIDPAQKEKKKTDEGHDGRHVVVTQNVKWADGRTYHDTFYSDYDPVDTVITYKSEADRKADEDKAKSEGDDKTE